MTRGFSGLPKPDIENLNFSGGTRFNSIDIKLANAMLGMLKQASAIEEASELLIEVTQKTNLYIKAAVESSRVARSWQC